MRKTSLTLFELNSLVRDALETTLDSPFWVEAELSEAREVRGHCYMELVQKDIFFGNTNSPRFCQVLEAKVASVAPQI